MCNRKHVLAGSLPVDWQKHSKLSFPAGILNSESSCGVCGGWAVHEPGSGDRGWSGGDGCLLGELGDGCLVGAGSLAQSRTGVAGWGR